MPVKLLLLLSLLTFAAGCSRDGAAAPASAPSVTVAADSQAAATTPTAKPASAKRQHAFKPGQKPVAAVDRVLLISIDGLRPDLLLRAYMPRVRGLCAAGSYTFWAETAPEAYTLPCHLTMLTGAPAAAHGVTWNEYIEDSYSNVPTIFELAKRAGLSTAMASGKMKFIVLTKPGTMDHFYLPKDEPVSDMKVATQAHRLLREHRPQVMFVHLPGVDNAGHDFGWGSAEQITAIERADEAVGALLTALSDLQLTGSTLILLTADHGGAGKNHAMNDPRARFIPWIASGPGIRQNHDLTLHEELRVGIEDTFATACVFLGIDPGAACEGVVVTEVIEAPKEQGSAHKDN